ncbi:hypothetical protein RIF29_32832 [Crotalaria pallida]|uniref:Uncharacterized protein n=1 Tax=Crotalaria pallida TaxID=3830 RepID=A0AAN9EIP3_CROPI
MADDDSNHPAPSSPPPLHSESESLTTQHPLPPPIPIAAEDVTVVVQDDDKVVEVEVEEPSSLKLLTPQNLVSFKEESNRVSDLSDSQRNALRDLNHLLSLHLTKQQQEDVSVSIWGVPLLKDERSDVILLKFLRARDFKPNDALTMLTNTLQWRNHFGIEALLQQDLGLGDDLDKVFFIHGSDRDSHPVCYNIFGEFQNKELYQKCFSTQECRDRFLRWRIQFLERSIRNLLHFDPAGTNVNTFVQVNDLHNSPGPAKHELRQTTNQALQLLQDNYPEFVAKQIFINVPWWYLAFYTMISPFLTQRTKSKFVFAGPSKSPDALFKYISPEQVPVQYGGLSVDSCDCNPDFSMSDPVTEIPLKPNTKQTIEIAIFEKCIIVWELRVVGWEVSYNAEFKPDAKDGYTVIIQKATKMSPTDEPVVSNSFKVGELGKLLLTIDNPTLKKKRLLYRFNIKPYSD